MRILHVSDLHGSTRGMHLTLSLYRELNADLLVVSGDLTGKCVCNENNYCKCVWGRPKSLDMGIEAFQAAGGYVVDADDKAIERNSPGLLAKAASERVKAWIEEMKDVNYFIIPGNVDHWMMDRILSSLPRELDFGGLTFKGASLVPYTPFGTYREGSEEDVWRNLPDQADVLVSHSPPKGLVDLSKYHGGGHVGSEAVRRWIEERQPVLSLHGHIHESRGFGKIGRTVVVNPGSEAEHGTLLYAVIDVDGNKIEVKLGERKY